jgi:hypothetical protein
MLLSSARLPASLADRSSGRAVESPAEDFASPSWAPRPRPRPRPPPPARPPHASPSWAPRPRPAPHAAMGEDGGPGATWARRRRRGASNAEAALEDAPSGSQFGPATAGVAGLSFGAMRTGGEGGGEGGGGAAADGAVPRFEHAAGPACRRLCSNSEGAGTSPSNTCVNRWSGLPISSTGECSTRGAAAHLASCFFSACRISRLCATSFLACRPLVLA